MDLIKINEIVEKIEDLGYNIFDNTKFESEPCYVVSYFDFEVKIYADHIVVYGTFDENAAYFNSEILSLIAALAKAMIE